jgi:hypothetical protein
MFFYEKAYYMHGAKSRIILRIDNLLNKLKIIY